MTLPALAMLLLLPLGQDPVAQDPAGPPPVDPVPQLPSQALYQPPPIRPFEPTAALSQTEPEGDSSRGTYRGPLEASVSLDAYHGQFEASPTDAALAYDQGVNSAEIQMDQRMGPLDGRWQLIDADGNVLMWIILTDFGPEVPIEGGWVSRTSPASGTLTSGRREANGVTLLLIDGATLDLSRSGGGYTGTLQNGRRRQDVTLMPRRD